MLDSTVAYRFIIRLSETREVDAVNSVFVEILNELINGHFALYTVQDGGRTTQFNLTSDSNPFGSKVEPILSLFNSKLKQRKGMFSGELRPIPLASRNGLHSILILERKAKVLDEVFFNALMTVYSNQFHLVENCSYDSLTGLMNRGSFDKKMHKLLELQNNLQREKDNEDNLSCLGILDIDHFKKVNDRYGHVYGDEVLLLLAQQMQRAFREEDWLFRYGGEEFAVIIRNVTKEQSEQVFERVRKAVEAFYFPQVGKVTISIGYTQLHEALSAGQLIGEADEALYYAKEHGRNQLHCYQTLIELGELPRDGKPTGDIQIF